MFSPLQNKQFDEDSGSVCFLCSRSLQKETVEADSRRRKERSSRRRNNNKSKVDFEQLSSSSKPQTQNAAKQILLKYLVGRCDDEELKGNLLSPNVSIKFCHECIGLAKEVQDLHLQLERIQMMLIDKLKTVKERIVQNSITFREWSEGSVRNDRKVDNDDEEVTRLMQLGCQFRTFVGNDDTNQVDVPLVFLEKFVGSKTFPEIGSSTSQPNQAKQMQSKNINDRQPKTEYISEQTQEPGASSCSTVPLNNSKKPQSKQLLRGDYWAQVKEEPEVDENPTEESRDDDTDVDFDPMNPNESQSDSEESTSPPELSSTRKAGNNCDIATSEETHVRCGSCGRLYANFSKLISHSRRFHRGTKLSCTMCPSSDETKLYSLRDEFPRHLDDIHGASSLRLECDFPSCSQRFYHLYDLERHKKLCHSKTDNDKPLLKCNSCSESFRSAHSFARHQMRVHGHTKLKCELCPPSPGRYLSTPKGLSNHVRFFHRKKDGEKFPCSKCPKVFALKGARNQHENLSHGERKFPCDKCDYVASQKSRLERHSRRVHVSTSSICEICGFASNNVDSLREHYLRMHDPEHQLQRKLAVNKFECSVCPKKFANSRALKRHILTHSGETPFHCDLCGQGFKVKGTLKDHMVSLHGQGEAKHPCSQCSKSFLNKTRLKLHMSSHTDERKFACDLCEKRFKGKWSLQQHLMNVHAIGPIVEKKTRKKWVCEVCGKDFLVKTNLKRHLLVHAK